MRQKTHQKQRVDLLITYKLNLVVVVVVMWKMWKTQKNNRKSRDKKVDNLWKRCGNIVEEMWITF